MVKKKQAKELTRDNFKEDVKSDKGFINPLKQLLKKDTPKKTKPVKK